MRDDNTENSRDGSYDAGYQVFASFDIIYKNGKLNALPYENDPCSSIFNLAVREFHNYSSLSLVNLSLIEFNLHLGEGSETAKRIVLRHFDQFIFRGKFASDSLDSEKVGKADLSFYYEDGQHADVLVLYVRVDDRGVWLVNEVFFMRELYVGDGVIRIKNE